MLKRQAKQGAAGIQHDIGKLYDLKNNIGEPQTIGVVGSQPNDSMQDTFLHEVLHAICHVMGLRETEKEENFVRRLATGLCTVWNHNPAVFKWWSGLVLVDTLAPDNLHRAASRCYRMRRRRRNGSNLSLLS